MDSQRYDHGMMADHVTAQRNLVAHLQDLQRQANGVLGHLQTIWKEHGSDAYGQCSAEVDKAFATVFDTIGRHAGAIQTASHSASQGDHAVAAMFRRL